MTTYFKITDSEGNSVDFDQVGKEFGIYSPEQRNSVSMEYDIDGIKAIATGAIRSRTIETFAIHGSKTDANDAKTQIEDETSFKLVEQN